ncbi:lytic murein transglycosylase B [Undibacterium sp. CY18W]|uniref:Lytic murein transglycosylase B n=1 Tax=Undibacterium hunanense TaxID=2762292 RepID=A0ABR6ZRB7_9BURK|nr:lytic murein transglycosylase B [Undibacterium hunanense]MBC3918149.1 lytic murein transglycosylase B [Undibacterium hunanense]
MKSSYSSVTGRLLTLVVSSLLIAPHAQATATKKPRKTSTAASASSSSDNTSGKSTSIKKEDVHFDQWKEVSAFIGKMVSKHGFVEADLIATFKQVRYVEQTRQLMRPAPPGKPKNWKAYRARFVEPYRIDAGVAFWDKYADDLARAEQQYGVPAEIIVGIIGVETIFGKQTGNFRVMDALTTLAFDYPDTPTRDARMQFFQSELENMLLMARESSLDPFVFKGSYAGAIGWPQFMPGSIRKYAVDFDGDGKINLTDSPVDAIGSVAHYLAEHGWKKNVPVAFPATLLSHDKSEALTAAIGKGLAASFQLQELKTLVSTASSDAPTNVLYGLIDLQNGTDATEYWLGTDNFYAITRYNRSYFYAMSVFDLGRVIAAARGK